jgi:hypothetical protein
MRNTILLILAALMALGIIVIGVSTLYLRSNLRNIWSKDAASQMLLPGLAYRYTMSVIMHFAH